MPRPYAVRRRQGFLLLIALSVMFVLLVLALALTYQGQSARLLFLNREGHDHEKQAVEITLARVGLALGGTVYKPWGKMFPPLGKVLSPGDTTAFAVDFQIDPQGGQKSMYRQPDSGYAAGIADELRPLPQVGYDPSATSTACGSLQCPPWSSELALNSPLGGRYLAAYNASFPYGAFAPHGSIEAAGVYAALNPTWASVKTSQQKQQPVHHKISLPVRLKARDAIRATDFPLGRAVSEYGPVNVAGGALGLTREEPAESHGSAVEYQILAAYTALVSTGFDKSKFIDGDINGISEIIQVFTTATGWENLFGLNEACNFWMPCFLSAQDNLPFYNVFMLHVPFPPDFKHGSDEGEKLSKQMADLQADITKQKAAYDKAQQDYDTAKSARDQAQGQVNQLNASITQLQQQIQNNPKSPDVKQWQQQLATDQKDLKTQQDSVKKQQAAMNEAKGRMTASKNKSKQDSEQYQADVKALQNWAGKGTVSSPPETSVEDDEFNNFGWAYIKPMVHIFKLFKDIITFHWSKIFGDLGEKVRLVHFMHGPPMLAVKQIADPDGGTFDFSMGGTWNVPRSRALKLSGNIQIQGDLWLQRGSNLTVSGDLNLIGAPTNWLDAWNASNPGVQAPLQPEGRIFLEEGATLCVGGNLTVGGSPSKGSVVVCGPVGTVHAPTSAIIVKGNARIPYSVMPGVTLDDLVGYYGKTNPGLKRFHDDFLQPLVKNVGFNIAKFLGAFQSRKSWFAKYATTIEQIQALNWIIPGLGEVPLPIPLPFENCAIPLFQNASLIFRWELSAALGENFMTETDWWVLGPGMAAVLPKIDPTSLADAFTSFEDGILDAHEIEQQIMPLLENMFESLIKDIITRVIYGVIQHLVEQAIPYNVNVTCSGPAFNANEPVDNDKKIVNSLKNNFIALIKKLGGQLLAQVQALVLRIESKLQKALEVKADGDNLMNEAPGVLIYAGKKLSIGSAGRQVDVNTPIAAGMFVAHDDVEISAQRTLGSVISVTGSIYTQDLYYYPYYTRASLVVPISPTNLFTEAVTFGLKISTEVKDIGADLHYHITGQGWDR